VDVGGAEASFEPEVSQLGVRQHDRMQGGGETSAGGGLKYEGGAAQHVDAESGTDAAADQRSLSSGVKVGIDVEGERRLVGSGDAEAEPGEAIAIGAVSVIDLVIVANDRHTTNPA